jgi:hydrophobic/amphiphilic exporter-1 (mainly G- bacteria), HAE1 family
VIGFFTRHPTAANLLMLLFAVLGLVALPDMRRETFPDFSLDALIITIVYPGASSETVEETVVQRVEDALDGVENVTEIKSQSQESLAQITVEMAEGGDMTTFQADVTSALDGIADLPGDTEDPVITRGGFSSAVVSIAVSGKMSAPDLKAYCEQLKRSLKRYPEIALVDVNGFSDRQLKIRLKEGVINQYGLSINALADTIAAQSLDMPAGNIETRDGEILVRLTEERRTREELEELVVLGGELGSEVTLGAIATIDSTFEDEEEKLIFNGQRAGLVTISKTKGEDALVILDAVNDFVAKQSEIAPKGVELTLTQDNASVIQDRLDLLVENGWQGLVLVFLTLWLFFNIRLAFWVAAGLPVSFLGALFVMQKIDYSLNMMTMIALLMALGLLMDDAIVLAENVASHYQRGKSMVQAAIDGVSEVAVGVLSSFVTTLAIFVPLAFLSGTIGKVMLVIPVVLCLVLAVSLVEAFCILPNHLSHVHGGEPGKLRKRFDAGFEHVRQNVLGKAVDWAVTHRYVTVGATVGIFIVSLAMFAGGILQFEAFPNTDGDIVQLRLLLPAGSPLSRTEETAEMAEEALERVNESLSAKQPGGAKLIRSSSTRFNFNRDAGEVGPHLATITADLLPAEKRVGRVDDLLTRWREELGPLSDVVSANFTEPANGPAGFAIEVRLQGDDLDHLDAAAQDTIAWFDKYEGVFNLRSDLRVGKPEIRVRMRPGAMSSQLNARTIAAQLRSGLSGSVARQILVGAEDYEVQVELARTEADSLSDLEYFQISLGNRRYVPLGTMTTLEPARGFSRITRVDGLRTVTVTGDVDTQVANAQQLVNLYKATRASEVPEAFPGVQVDFEGESAETAKTMGSMVSGFGVGLFAIFVLLSFQFRSYIEPIIVMVAIPLALVGVVFGNILMGDNLSLPGVLGFCALAGVVVNDSILLVEAIKEQRRQGVSIPNAARAASRLRFRAVLLTSVTTMAGLIPLMFETSAQAQTLIPIATSIVFGTLTSTLLVLIVLPAMYAILGDLGWATEEEIVEEIARSRRSIELAHGTG